MATPFVFTFNLRRSVFEQLGQSLFPPPLNTVLHNLWMAHSAYPFIVLTLENALTHTLSLSLFQT